jgi:hypothetical protein
MAIPTPSASERIVAERADTNMLLAHSAAQQSQQAQTQRTKQSILNAVRAEAVDEESNLTRRDIDAIGKLLKSMMPSGGNTNMPQVQPQVSSSGRMLSQVRGRPTQAIDTFEQYRISQEMRMVRQAYIKTKLDAGNAHTQEDRDAWNMEKMDEKVTEQTRAFAV